jgi:two-component system sensor histidine kinase UhpB
MLSASCPPEAKTRLEETIKLVESTVERMRGIMAEYRPPMLDAYGLTAALYWYAEQFTRRTGIHVQIEDRFMRQSRLPVGLEIGLFRIVQEAMTNTAKHAQASEISINLTQSDSELMLVVQDNGQGFEVEQASTTSGHWGLVIMRERAAALGGTLRIEPGPLNGIKITARLPYVGKR